MSFTFEMVISLIVTTSVISVFIAIFINFITDDKNKPVKKSKRSIVATGTMTLYYLFYYVILRFEIGIVSLNNDNIYYSIVIIGTIIIAAGAIINIKGRLILENNWANHIKIYENHNLVKVGAYGIVRHPLYASIMLMLLGGSFVYRNWISLILTIGIFIPFMYYRAKQEEELLQNEFSEYKDYIRKVGMFFPKMGGSKNDRI